MGEGGLVRVTVGQGEISIHSPTLTLAVTHPPSSSMKEYSNIIDICTEHVLLKTSIQRELPTLQFNLLTNQKFNSLRLLTSSQNVENNSAYFSYAAVRYSYDHKKERRSQKYHELAQEEGKASDQMINAIC